MKKIWTNLVKCILHAGFNCPYSQSHNLHIVPHANQQRVQKRIQFPVAKVAYFAIRVVSDALFHSKSYPKAAITHVWSKKWMELISLLQQIPALHYNLLLDNAGGVSSCACLLYQPATIIHSRAKPDNELIMQKVAKQWIELFCSETLNKCAEETLLPKVLSSATFYGVDVIMLWLKLNS